MRARLTVGLVLLALAAGGCSSAVAGSAEAGATGVATSASVASSGGGSSTGSATPPTSFLVPTGLSIPAPTSVVVSSPPDSSTGAGPTPTTSAAPRTTPPRTTAPPTTRPRTTAPPPTTSSSTATAANDYITPCGEIDIRVVSTITDCLSASVSDFWSGQLNQVVAEKVVVSPTKAQVPTACQPGLTAAPAFTCDVDETLYITSDFVALIGKYFTGSDVIYAYASILAHEIGHVVQQAVDQPGYGTAAQSVMIEQQADCLAGVWAAYEVGQGKLDGPAFVDVARRLITLVSSNAEIDSHGTPAARAAAVSTGLQGGRPQSCKLATFS